MSVYYNVKEHLTVKNDGLNNAAEIMAEQLSFLYSRVLINDAEIFEISAIIDGKEYRCDKWIKEHKLPDAKEYSELLEALFSFIDCADIVCDYSFNWHSGIEHLNLGFALSNYLDNAPDEELENVRYTFYNTSDSNCDDSGTLCFYGKVDGKISRGAVPFEAVSDFPNGK